MQFRFKVNILMLIIMFVYPVGCHLVGFTRKVTIPDCIEFPLTTNACRGFCESFAVSSNFAIGPHRPDQPVRNLKLICSVA